MDSRQLLEGVAASAVLGDLADDVVLAIHCVAADDWTDATSATLQEASKLLRALVLYEGPTLQSWSELDAMSPIEALSATVDRFVAQPSDKLVTLFSGLGDDLDLILSKEADEENLRSVEAFFEQLSLAMLQSTDNLLRADSRSTGWTTPAFSS